MPLTQEKKEKIVNVLNQKCGGTASCSRCGRGNFTLLDDYYHFHVQEDVKNIVMGGPVVPAYGVACENCGHLVFHAVNAITPGEA